MAWQAGVTQANKAVQSCTQGNFVSPGSDNAKRCIHAQLTLPAAIATEALVARGHQQTHTQVGEHTLLHGEALLVLATHDLEDVALLAQTI